MKKEDMGYCEGLCGGLYDHHLVDGLCPKCKLDTRIQADELCPDEYDGVPLGVESALIIPNLKYFPNGYIRMSKQDLINKGWIHV